MSFAPRLLAEEHLVRRDENGYSLDHVLVADTSRSLLKEMEDMIELQQRMERIRRIKHLKARNYRANSVGINRNDSQRVLRYNINNREITENIHKKRDNRVLIDYKDLDCFDETPTQESKDK